MDNQLPPLPPQAPPPLQPITPHHNPYSFITNPPPPPKKSLIPLPKGSSKLQRLLFAVVGVFVLVLIAIVVMSFLNKGNADLKTSYTSLLQQQAELVRVSDIGVSKAYDTSIKNFAITTKLTMASQQQEILALAKKSGADTSPKSLALGKNTKTDEQLKTAEQNNQFDVTFGKTLIASLQTYQETLKKVRDGTSSQSAKKTISGFSSAVDQLLGKTSTSSQ